MLPVSMLKLCTSWLSGSAHFRKSLADEDLALDQGWITFFHVAILMLPCFLIRKAGLDQSIAKYNF